MKATVYEVLEQGERGHVRQAGLSDFNLQEQGQTAAIELLENQQITLYGLDFEKKQAVFVETPADVDLSQVPFFMIAQQEQAKRVWTVTFDVMLELAESVELDDSRLVSIYSVGRCGSTLASQLFAQVPGVINISEPAVLSQLVVARNMKTAPNELLVTLLAASVRLLCKTPTETAWVVKGQSFVIELADWMNLLFPNAKNLFLYRHAQSWLRSGLRAFGRADDVDAVLSDQRVREVLGPLVPLIAQYDPERLLPHAGALSLMWIRAMACYVDWCEMGMQMLAIRYESWRSAPQQTAEAMLDYCGCKPSDLTAVYQTLNQDSQKDSHLSRETLGQTQRTLADNELSELNRHLQEHAFINAANFEVPNTL